VHPGRHWPPTGGFPLVQVAQSVPRGPVHVRHDGSQAAQAVSVVRVQAALSYCPAEQDAEHARHEQLPALGWYDPTGQSEQNDAPARL
jgi:hypothetical protein